MRCLIPSVACSAAFTNSMLYGEGPLTWFTLDQAVRLSVMKAGSQQLSNSLKMTLMDVEIALHEC